jgi:hypothetical protein
MRLHFSGARQPSGDIQARPRADRKRPRRPILAPRFEELESRQLLSGGLTLTARAQAAGFNLTTFATGFPERSDGSGPLGIAFPSGGGVLVGDTHGNVRLLPSDADGQDATTAPPVAGASFGEGNAAGMALVNGNIYLNMSQLNQIGLMNPDGTLKKVVANVPIADGMTVNPQNGHLFVSGYNSAIYDVDPLTGTASVLLNVTADGLAFDPVAGVLYAALYPEVASNQRVEGFDITSKSVVFDSGLISGAPDGIALGAGTLAGNIFVNTNGGDLVEVNLKTSAQTVIASGGSRGDFVTADPNNGTLLVTQSDRILRLAGPAGGSFTTTSSGSVDGPRITLVQRSQARAKPTKLVLNFDEPLDPALAQDVAAYHLIQLRKRSPRPIRIKSAVYDPAARRVALTLAGRINLHPGVRLTVAGTGAAALATVSGTHLDGRGDGRPGSDYVAVVTTANPVFIFKARAPGTGGGGTR